MSGIDSAKVWAHARKAALENAIKHEGKAAQGAIIGSLMQSYPEIKSDMKQANQEIAVILKEVNALSLDEQKQELLAIDPEYFTKEQEKREERKAARSELPDLPQAVQGKVVMRICPEPSKYNHLGHALNFLINYQYAKKYDGECVLRFDDTNPEKESQEYVDAMEHDVLSYLDIKPSKVVFVSDHIPKYYECCEDVIKRKLAYTCTCPSETMSKNRRDMQECSCRNKEVKTIQQEWQHMLSGKQAEGTMTLRLKIDMQHKNAVMRDPVIMRIIHTAHYRQKREYNVWPMYDFESALEDSWLGSTHILRSNEFETRIELQNYIQDLFQLPHQFIKQYGRFTIEGATTQGREIRQLIEEGKVIGWDDPRLVTLRALKRRGITREAFYELAKTAGMSKSPTNLSFDVLAAINRSILDESANRYFFVQKPVKIVVQDWPESLNTVELKLHPHKNRGGRELKLDGKFYVAQDDYNKICDGKLFRLIDTANVRYNKEKKVFVFESATIDDFKKAPKDDKHGLIHFLPQNEALVQARIFMPDATYQEGLCEPGVLQLREGAHIQFERHCFARLDAIENKKHEGKQEKLFTFWFTHE